MSKIDNATFGAGCFWGVEAAFKMQKGILKTTVGYTGGIMPNPTYEQVCSGTTGHIEAIEIEYDPQTISYQRLLDIFWQLHDPTLKNRQGNDVGSQYQAAIFYHNQQQKLLAEASKAKLQKSGQFDRPIQTVIKKAEKFYPAEEEHQRYLEKHPGGYCHIDLKSIN